MAVFESLLSYQQLNALWGIKPNWLKNQSLMLNLKKVATKPTFKQAF
jgi:hypothetical protein